MTSIEVMKGKIAKCKHGLVDGKISMVFQRRGMEDVFTLGLHPIWIKSPPGVAYDSAKGEVFVANDASSTVSVIDDSSNTVSAVFTVTVSPSQAIQQIINNIGVMNLDHGIANSLDAKLDVAISSLSSGDNTTAKNQLDAFIHEANAQAGKKITQDQANQLISEAQDIINSIS